VEHHSTKHKELSEQLASWWRTQTDFKTKKALAGFLKVHPDTLGDYFSGRKFPRSDIADRLRELTNIGFLKRDFNSDSSSEMVSQESSPRPMSPHPTGAAASIEESPESDITWPSDQLKEELNLGGIPEVVARRPTREIPQEEGRYGERSVVISLQRTSCPFCEHDIARFRCCANVPLESEEPL